MPAFLNKARNNVKTAAILINNGLPKNSAHPAYYSVFLLMKYVLAHFYSTSYDHQAEITKNTNSHKVISSKVLIFLKNEDPKNGNMYFEWYNKLKMIRRKADYKPVEIKNEILDHNFADAKVFFDAIMKHYKIV